MATVYVAYQICTYSSTRRVADINPLDNGATIFAFIAICYCGFELTLVVIGTDCIGTYKTNYHTITDPTVP
jgi:hypothetical protein